MIVSLMVGIKDGRMCFVLLRFRRAGVGDGRVEGWWCARGGVSSSLISMTDDFFGRALGLERGDIWTIEELDEEEEDAWAHQKLDRASIRHLQSTHDGGRSS